MGISHVAGNAILVFVTRNIVQSRICGPKIFLRDVCPHLCLGYSFMLEVHAKYEA